MVGDVDDNKVSSVQNFMSLGGVEAPNSYNDQGQTDGWRDGWTFCVLSGVALQLKQAQVCAEGCDEGYITNIFLIQQKHKVCTLNRGLQD